MRDVIALVVAVVAGVIAIELSIWMPRWAEALLRRAVAQVPEDLRERLDEEWRADLLTLPSGMAQLMFAASLWLRGARKFRDQAGRCSLFFSTLGRLIVGYGRLGWLSCKFAWLAGRLIWGLPQMRTVLVLQAIGVIVLGSWLASGYQVLYWVNQGFVLANMGYQMWTTPLLRVYGGSNCALLVLSSIHTAHPEWFPPGFSPWGFVVLIVLNNAYMIRKMVTMLKRRPGELRQ